MLRAFFLTRQWALWAWGGAALLLALTYAQVHMTVLLNEWYKAFYDLLQNPSDIALFWQKIIDFSFIAFPYIIIAVFASYLARHYAFRWRQAITFHYLPLWERAEGTIEGASQRIQEDAYQFASILESLGLGLFRALMTLMAFIPILWGLSSSITLPVLRDIPGVLVWIALLTSLGGIGISWFVGIRLPGLEYNNQRVEAAFRKQLVFSEDDKRFAAVPQLAELFVGLRFNYFRLFNHYTYFNLWENLYGQLMIILPFLIAGPALFPSALDSGLVTQTITLGIVVQISNSFDKVNGSFSYLIDRWTDITKFRSVIKRLREFERLLAAQQFV